MVRWSALLILACLISPAKADQDFLISLPENHPLEQFARADLSEAYSRLGLHVVFKSMPSARAIDEANQGITDAEAARITGIEQQFPNLVQVPEPLAQYDLVAISIGAPIAGEGWESLRGHRVCIHLGEKLVEKRTKGMQVEPGRSTEIGLRMLKAGRCDVMVISPYHWLDIDRLHLGPFCVGSTPLESVQLYHYLNRRHADLVPKLAEALRAMREDGTTARLFHPLEQQLDEAKARNVCGGKTSFRDAAHR